ncbi:MAG TPA: GAF domain-containing protein [Chloroflexota bacterium]|nr:GAF domain-containing protein [Chloroflexota bacterium]
MHQPTWERFAHQGKRGVLAPIRHADTVIGVLAVVWGNEHASEENDLAMLRLVAEQAGGAIAWACLAEEERAQLQLRAAERARLAESEARFRGAFRHSASGRALLDADGRYTQVNGAICRMLG